MNNKKMKIAAIVSALLLMGAAVPLSAAADTVTANTHTVMVRRFDGTPFPQSFTVPDGTKVSDIGFDTDELTYFPDLYTEMRFNGWINVSPDTPVTSDMMLEPLYIKKSLNIVSKPTKWEYFARTGTVNTDGLKVTITVDEQDGVRDENGKLRVLTEVVDITSKCYAEPSTLEEVFADNYDSFVAIYPPGSTKKLFSYHIQYCNILGDIDRDGDVDPLDASAILGMYSKLSTETDYVPSQDDLKFYDIDRNGFINTTDASLALSFYSEASTSKEPITWEDFFAKHPK